MSLPESFGKEMWTLPSPRSAGCLALQWRGMALGKSPPNLQVGFGPKEKRWAWTPGSLARRGSSAAREGCRSLAMVGDAAGSGWWALVGIGSDETKPSSQNHVSLGCLGRGARAGVSCTAGFFASTCDALAGGTTLGYYPRSCREVFRAVSLACCLSVHPPRDL